MLTIFADMVFEATRVNPAPVQTRETSVPQRSWATLPPKDARENGSS